MECPVCKGVKLVMSERQGIEIDYCPGCRGVWLDRGELDKIIDKAADSAPPPQAQHQVRHDPYQGQQRPSQGYEHPQRPYGHNQDGYYKKKRKGLLGELFDFD